MDDIEKIVNDLVDNHYANQHLIGTHQFESEYLQETYYSFNKALKRELEEDEKYIQHKEIT